MPDLECPKWFQQWSNDYTATFGATDELAATMIRVWWPAFAAEGFVESDFAEALARLVGSGTPAPRWNREYLPHARTALNAARAERQRRGPKAVGGCGRECSTCDRGFVVVPHPADVRDGVWLPPFRTGVVLCHHCHAGRELRAQNLRLADEGKVREKCGTLDDYELRVDPAWREHLAERAEADRLMRHAESVTANLQSGFPRLAKAMANGTYQPPEPRRRPAS